MKSSNDSGDLGPVVILLPSLSHMCLAKIAIILQSVYGLRKLKKAFSDIESTKSPESRVCLHINDAALHRRVKECLLLIPTNLRKIVLETVKGVEHQIVEWIQCHEKRSKLYYFPNFTFFWRSEGTIDRLKTAQEIVRTENIDIRARFEMACMYCLSESVQTLWKTLELNSEKLQAGLLCGKDSFYCSTNFWIKWLRQGARCQWTEAAAFEYIGCGSFKLKFNTLFRELMPEQRPKFFKSILISDKDDLRLCLYVVTKEERREIMELFAEAVPLAYSEWPLTDIFLDQADKSWEFLSVASFLVVLGHLLDIQSSTNVGTENLAEEFWERSPDRLKENVKLGYIHQKKIIEFIEKMTHKNDD